MEVKSWGNETAPLTGSALTAEGFGDTRLSVAASMGQMNPIPPRVSAVTHWECSFSRGKKRSLLNPCCWTEKLTVAASKSSTAHCVMMAWHQFPCHSHSCCHPLKTVTTTDNKRCSKFTKYCILPGFHFISRQVSYKLPRISANPRGSICPNSCQLCLG